MILGSALLLLGTLLVLGWALHARSHDALLSRRIALIKRIRPPAGGPPRSCSMAAIRRARLPDIVRGAFAYRMRRSWGISTGAGLLLGTGTAAAATVWAAGQAFMHLPTYVVLGLCGAAFLLIPRLVLVKEQRWADAAFAELMPDAMDMAVRMVRAGLPIAVAIRTIGEEGAPPLSTVFRRIADQCEIGVVLDKALADASVAVGNADFRFFAVAVALQQSTGGNIAATLESLSDIIRKRRAVRLKARAATAEVRMSALVLGAIPFCVSGALLLVAPTYLDPLVLDARGNVILGLALSSLLMAGMTMRAMIRRSLTSAT